MTDQRSIVVSLAFAASVLATPQACAQEPVVTTKTAGDNVVTIVLEEPPPKADGLPGHLMAAEFKGSITITSSGKVTELDGTIITLDTADGQEKQSITSTRLQDGTLVISSKSGRTWVLDHFNKDIPFLHASLTGAIREVKKTPATTAKRPKAKAMPRSPDVGERKKGRRGSASGPGTSQMK